MRRALFALALAAAGTACGSRRRPLQRGAIVARVEGEAIHEDLVRVTALREGVDASTALRLLINEALLAREAQRLGLAEGWAVESARWHALVARLLELEVEAPYGPDRVPADQLDASLAARRAQFCHDGLRRVAHVVFRVAERDPAAQRAAAQQAAQAFRAELGTRTAEHPSEAQLLEAGRGVRGFTVVAEPLAGIDRHAGLASGGGVVESFARAVWAIDPSRPLSPVFETSFGYHVALLLEEIPPSGVPCDALRLQLARELSTQRRATAMQELLARLRARSEFRVDRGALQAAEAAASR